MIQEYVDKHLKEKQDDRKPGGGKWKPHMLGRCYRAHYWTKHNEPPTNPPDQRALRIFQAGHLFHDFVQDLIPDKNTEVDVEDDLLRGRADIVTADTVWDIKSQHSRAFWYMKKDGYDTRQRKYNNWLQVMWYALRLGKEKAGICFISKDDLCMAEYIEYVNKWQDDIACELYYLACIDALDVLPKPSPRAYKDKYGKSKECQYCNYKDKCWKMQGKRGYK